MDATPLIRKISGAFLIAAAIQLGAGIWWLSDLNAGIVDIRRRIDLLETWQWRHGDEVIVDTARLKQELDDLRNDGMLIQRPGK